MCYYDHAVAMKLKLDRWSGDVDGRSSMVSRSSSPMPLSHRKSVFATRAAATAGFAAVAVVVCWAALTLVVSPIPA